MEGKLKIKRIYEPYEESDGYRILVDRLWPRGIKKTDAHLDAWEKEAAPSNELRKWFKHDKDKYEEFKQKYIQELNHNDKWQELKEKISKGLDHENVTLLYGAKDKEDNQARVLMEYYLKNKEQN